MIFYDFLSVSIIFHPPLSHTHNYYKFLKKRYTARGRSDTPSSVGDLFYHLLSSSIIFKCAHP